MKRKRVDEDVETEENKPLKKKRKCYEKFFLETEIGLPDEKVSIATLRTTVSLDGWVFFMSNPYYDGVYFFMSGEDVDFEDKDFAFEMLKCVLEGNENEKIKGFRYFFSKISEKGESLECEKTPKTPLHCFVVVITVDLEGEEEEIYYPLFPRKKRETEEYLEKEIEELSDKIEDLEMKLDNRKVQPPPPLEEEEEE